MAIVQISRITNRKGLTENLPQLAGAEFGWCVDSRRLFIGNGTLQEGAPVIGNTEILTEFSDITVLSDYTYQDIIVGYAPQTGPSPTEPVVRSVQERLDDYVSVRAFGAVGDGNTDDTDAINRALFQLYCRETNTQIRRSLFFPAGTYRITDTILIPTYAKLFGEGADSTIILLDTRGNSSIPLYVARYSDSLQQTGAQIGSNGATPPRDIEISSMRFQTIDESNVFLVEAARNCWFNRVNFRGPVTVNDLLDTSFSPALTDISGVKFASNPNNPCLQIIFDSCGFFNLTYGIKSSADITGITVTNSALGILYQGVVLESNSTGFRVVHNVFDNIFSEGIVYDTVSLNVSAYNVFYNVGNNIGSLTPTTPVIRFGNENNVSIGDMFTRSYSQAAVKPSVQVLVSPSTSLIGSTGSRMGRYARNNGLSSQITAGVSGQVFALDSTTTPAFSLDYYISRTVGAVSTVRKGTMTILRGPSDDSSADSSWSDDYVENSDTGVTLSVQQSGDVVSVNYIATSGNPGTIYYSISYLA